MSSVNKYLSSDVIMDMRDAISDSNENEVFFAGSLNSNNVVETIDVLARGNKAAVIAISRLPESVDVVIHNHPSGTLHPSQNDLHISSDLERKGICSYIVNNQVDDIYVVVEPLQKHEVHQLNEREIGAVLEPDGAFSKHLKGYEFRDGQIEMLSSICEAFNQNKIALIEAGTGIGKTLAYLLPSVHWSIMNKERCVISTNTINLQEQIINKDIPLIQSVLESEFKALLVKGRSNYVCMRKVAEIESEPGLLIDTDEDEEMNMLLNWVKTTKDGSKSDLNFLPKFKVWEKIASESDTCSRAKCAFYGKCFVNKARREAVNANIIVANHHLLFADFAVRRIASNLSILPPYKRLILDEAHHIESVATSYLGAGVTRMGTIRILRRLYRQKRGDMPRGYLPLLKRRLDKLRKKNRLQKLNDMVVTIEQRLSPAVVKLEGLTHAAMDTIGELSKAVRPDDFGEIKLRIIPPVKNDILWQPVEDGFSVLNREIKRFCTELSRIVDTFRNNDIEIGDDFVSLLIDIKAQTDRLSTSCKVIEQILFEEDKTNIRWIESKAPSVTRLKLSPLEVNAILQETVYDHMETVVMTSATLSVSGFRDRGEFDFIMHRIGLDLVNKERIMCSKLMAPFDYRAQVILGIPGDIPSPDSQTYKQELLDLLKGAVALSGGRAFILFTSYGLLNYVFQRMEKELAADGILALRQGSDNRHRLLEKFRKNETSVLFATDSFWEGVDVPGKSLQSVVITKLPFQVPTEPVVEARVEAIKQSGGNAFMEYSVPQAVIKLRQGFGRLIRSRSDTGFVLIFDRRLVDKFYGRVFLDSLPETTLSSGPLEHVFKDIENFMLNQ